VRSSRGLPHSYCVELVIAIATLGIVVDVSCAVQFQLFAVPLLGAAIQALRAFTRNRADLILLCVPCRAQRSSSFRWRFAESLTPTHELSTSSSVVETMQKRVLTIRLGDGSAISQLRIDLTSWYGPRRIDLFRWYGPRSWYGPRKY
jgi:hypothetical protein